MRKIYNPYTTLEGYNCFGCSPGNPWGLKLEFEEDGDFLISRWVPENNFSGYRNVLHGGIQATLQDEIASWIVQIKLKTAGLTGSLSIRYRRPVYVDRGELTLKARIEKQVKKLAYVKTWLYDSSGELCSEGDITYFIFPEEVARRRLSYPPYDDFFTEK